MTDPDPLWDVRPGDRAPITHYAASAVCGERWDVHRCERFPDHPGQHIAGHPDVTAVWIRRTIAANGLTQESTPQEYARYRTLLAYPGLTGADVDELDLPDEAGATLARDHVRRVLVSALTIGQIDQNTANSIMRGLGLHEVQDPHKVVTVEVKIKTRATTTEGNARLFAQDRVERALAERPDLQGKIVSVQASSVTRVEAK